MLCACFIAYKEYIFFWFLELIEKKIIVVMPIFCVFYESDKAQIQKGQICLILQYEVTSGMN